MIVGELRVLQVGPLAMMDQSKPKNTKASRLVDRLREAILTGEFGPGSKINLEHVRRDFDVSLSPLREALARLATQGLVEFHDNRGYTVAPVSLGNLAEITRLRAEFDCQALQAATANGDLEWESDVMRALHRLNRTARDPADRRTPGAGLEAWERAHREFHMALLAGSGMKLLLGFCATLYDLNDRYRRAVPAAACGDRDVAAEHGEIAHGAVARDADYCCRKLRQHIERTGRDLRARLAGGIPP